MHGLEHKKINYITIDTKNQYDVEQKQDYEDLNCYDDIFNKANKYVRIKRKLNLLADELLKDVEKEETIIKLRKIEKIVYEKWKIQDNTIYKRIVINDR